MLDLRNSDLYGFVQGGMCRGRSQDEAQFGRVVALASEIQ